MPSRNIYLTPAANEALATRTTGNRDVSQVACRIIERYAEVVKRRKPELSEAEWNLIREACNGWVVEPAAAVGWLSMQVEDAIKINNLDRKWQVDGAALVKKVRSLDYADCLAVVDDVEQYWTHHKLKES